MRQTRDATAAAVCFAVAAVLTSCADPPPTPTASPAPTAITIDGATCVGVGEDVCDEAPTASEDVEASADDLRQDAVEYSATFGVSVEEARRRLELQPALGSLIHEMEGLAPTRFAGGWIEHEPEYRVVVRFSGDDVGLGQAIALARSAPVPVIVETGAPFSLSQLLDGLGRISQALDKELPDVASGVDVQAGGLLLTSPTLIPAETIAELEAAAGVPIRVEQGPQQENQHTMADVN